MKTLMGVSTKISGEEKLHIIFNIDGFVTFYLLSSCWVMFTNPGVESHVIIWQYKNQLEINTNNWYFIFLNDKFNISISYSFGIHSWAPRNILPFNVEKVTFQGQCFSLVVQEIAWEEKVMSWISRTKRNKKCHLIFSDSAQE